MHINLEELTIDQIHDYYKTGELSCKDLVQGYLNRIEAFDKKGEYKIDLIQATPSKKVCRFCEFKGTEYCKYGV